MRTPIKSYCSEEMQSTYYRITWYAQSDVMVLTITSGEGGRSRHCMERSKLNPNSLQATVFSSSGIAGHLERYILIQKTQNRLIWPAQHPDSTATVVHGVIKSSSKNVIDTKNITFCLDHEKNNVRLQTGLTIIVTITTRFWEEPYWTQRRSPSK